MAHHVVARRNVGGHGDGPGVVVGNELGGGPGARRGVVPALVNLEEGELCRVRDLGAGCVCAAVREVGHDRAQVPAGPGSPEEGDLRARLQLFRLNELRRRDERGDGVAGDCGGGHVCDGVVAVGVEGPDDALRRGVLPGVGEGQRAGVPCLGAAGRGDFNIGDKSVCGRQAREKSKQASCEKRVHCEKKKKRKTRVGKCLVCKERKM